MSRDSVELDSIGPVMTVIGRFKPAAGAAMTVRTAITYASGQIIAQSATPGSCSAIAIPVARIVDASGMLRRLRIKSTDLVNFAGKIVRGHVFRDNPTFANGDNAAFAAGLTESEWIGAFDVTFDQSFSDFVKGIGVPINGPEMNFIPSAGTQNVFLVYEARGAIGPTAAAKTLTPTIEVLQN